MENASQQQVLGLGVQALLRKVSLVLGLGGCCYLADIGV